MNIIFIILIFIFIKISYKSQFNQISESSSNSSSSSNSNLIFIHIPKTGGSSVEYFFNEHGYALGKYMFPGETNGIHNWHLTPKQLNLNLKNSNSFCIVRDPINRYISEINYLCTNEINGINDINNFTKELFSSGPLLNKYDNHFIPQSDYLYDKYGNRIKTILQFSDLENQIKDFIKKNDLNVVWGKEKHNPGKIKFSRNDLNTDSIKLLNNYYKKDFKLII
jgi:hypothetical protein